MNLVKSGVSAVGRLLIIVALLGAFLAGMFGVVIYSLRGQEVQVPELVGKDYLQSEKELAALGLKIKKRATRYSQEAPNLVLEQSPRPGETVKTGIPIFVTVSRAFTEGDEAPVDIEKNNDDNKPVEQPDNEPVNTSLTKKDKPKPKANTNANKASSNSNTATNGGNKNSEGGNDNSGAKNSNTANPVNKNNNKSTTPSATPKPQPAKTPAGAGDTRPRRNP